MTKKPLTYISLFSSAGIGCYGFKKNGFECIATNEILAKRLKIQRFNSKCKFDSGYISGDITKREVKQQLLDELELWKETYKILSPDVLIATPPCQGMSVANHKKNNEKSRNSLVVESIKLTNQIRPKYFVFENVRAFLNTICTDLDGIDKPIKEAISVNLGGDYNILSKIVNFKNYGSNSSRTRSLVIGVRKDIKHCSPYDIFPEKSKPKTLRQLIGDLQSLTKMGEISKDIFHAYREFDQRMLPWIETLKEGQSAFENKDSSRIPHRIVNGEVIYNKSKNGDKYARWYWDKEGPCVHTRNDILSSQNTVHPSDNRVFSIRELMRMLSIPESFEWSNIKTEKLNQLSDSEKKVFLKKEELNIRHCLGEAVPTGVFKSIAKNIKRAINEECLTSADLETIKEEFKLNETQSIIDFVEANIKNYALYNVLLIIEYAYSEMQNTLKQLTTKDVVYSVINELPELKKKKKIRILEPSVNIGSFIPMLFNKYEEKDEVVLDIYDNDKESMQILKALLSLIKLPNNFKIHIVNLEEIHMDLTKTYDIIIDRKPSLKVTKADVLLKSY
ncbi:DNA cytosine methyltransferase [Winogradskyella flava]|uniref:DNA cytosine methyltransferase n=1 Tax=Winogradskyella flava TaxID=1884876 RepID=UPI0024908376|nr:DNA cytosine methyltransferase [Winogradskyella flava]